MAQLAEKREHSPELEGVIQGSMRAESPNAPENRPVRPRLKWSIFALVTAIFSGWYAAMFLGVIRKYWFHPAWTTDDALQQVYPFYEALHPGTFEGDLITEVMVGYLAPAHYWLSYGITKLTGDPMMMSHWVMLIQVALTLGFLFMAVRVAAGTVPAMLAVTWLLHTRHTMQRLTGGLPRGWAAPVFTAFLYFAFKGNHYGVLATILLGCLLNPPATMVVAVAYGLLLIWRWGASSGKEERTQAFRRLVSFVMISPVFILLTLAVVYRPPSIGQMVSFDVASQMPEFSRPFGRFPFIPFSPALDEIRVFGLQAFVGRFYNPGKVIRELMPWFAVGGLVFLAAVGAVRKRIAIPVEVVCFGIGALSVYFLSRELAFRLYVPNRHLQIPLAVFFISAFCIGGWRAFHRAPSSASSVTLLEGDSSLTKSWMSMLSMISIGAVVYVGSGLGLTGAMNFNYSLDKHGGVFEWLKQNTPQTALIGGHPTHLDATQLFAARRAYVTTETTHPFYTRYYAEMKRRTEIAMKAHYSANLTELLSLVEPERIDYFVFKRFDFKGDNLANVTFFPPLDVMVKELVSRPKEDYAYMQLPKKLDREQFPFVPYIDRDSLVVDIKKLREFIDSGRSVPPVQTAQVEKGMQKVAVVSTETNGGKKSGK